MGDYCSDVRVICCTLAGSEYAVQNNNIYKISGVKKGNSPFLSCLVPLSQSESWCIAFHMKMSFHSHADKLIFI